SLTTQYGCDSLFTIYLHIYPIYRSEDRILMSDEETRKWEHNIYIGCNVNSDTLSPAWFEPELSSGLARPSIITIPSGSLENHFDTTYPSIHACDSTRALFLLVAPTFRDTLEDWTCDNEPYHWFHTVNGIRDNNEARTDIVIQAPGFYYDSLKTSYGFDSIFVLNLHNHPTYTFTNYDTICQTTTDIPYSWLDDFGSTHYATGLSTSVAGDFQYTDSLTTQYGCDSLFTIYLHIHPTYHFHFEQTICANESFLWQGKLYAGHLSADTISADTILPPATHYDTIKYLTQALCDSIYDLQLTVHPIYDTKLVRQTCRNEDYVWENQDIQGTYSDLVHTASFPDTIRIPVEDAMNHAPYHIPADTLTAERLLHSIHGCDSLVHLELHVHPSYLFLSDTTICSNVRLLWRGRYFGARDTLCYDTLSTAHGCDSIYMLRLHIQPAYLFSKTYELCDNETIYHNDNGIDVVWRPNMPISDYTDLLFYTDFGCDSIYRYYLHIHPTYYFEEDATFCSNEAYPLHPNKLIDLKKEYDTHQCVAPIDTCFIDSLSTIYGCDSVYRLNARILPAYHYIEFDTICANQPLEWRGQTIHNLSNGEHIVWDSLLTHLGCDSVYELRLRVWDTYFYEEHASICADETYSFNGTLLNQSGFYTDSLLSIHGCDSVFHLYLTVLDTTCEFISDTICIGETYYLHGVPITDAGFYKDTTLNEYNCSHFTYLTLTLLPPTQAFVYADSICADEEAFEIAYSYTGQQPIAYSLLFDDFGHSQAFEDLHYIPFTADSSIVVPTPFKQGDKTQYPRPDHYTITLILHNGYCQNDSMYPAQGEIIMNYPSWVTEQRFRDVIAILDTKYNGGYEFTSFQWYENGEEMPGETHEYLYLPHELKTTYTDYHVRLIRPGETESFQTCPIRIFPDPIDTLAPNLPYISVVPTIVSILHPIVNILSVNTGSYQLFNSMGILLQQGAILPDEHHAMEIQLPDKQGIYIFHLRDNETTHREKERTIKVVVQ
ncbi:MAG: hypothetical protein ACI4TV_03235, partial [Paludibacteraceae bacterium]